MMDEGVREVDLDDIRYQTSSSYHRDNRVCICVWLVHVNRSALSAGNDEFSESEALSWG